MTTSLQTTAALLADVQQALASHHSLFTPEQRQALQDRIEALVNYQAVVGILGKTGSGKSSLCNALFGQDVAAVDDIAGCTRYPQEFTLAYKNGKGIALIDVPGVGESEDRDQDYAGLYQRLLPELDLILWVIKADDRALAIDQNVFFSVIRPYLAQRDIPVVFVINQCDKIEPCRQWDEVNHLPGFTQQANIVRKRTLVGQVFSVSPDQVCAVSAAEGYGLMALVEQIVIALPNQKKWAIARETRPEHVTGLAAHTARQGLWEVIKETARSLVQEGWSMISNKVESWLGRLFR